MAPPLCHGVDQTYPIIRLAYIRLRQSVALVPLSHRATAVHRSIGWPVSKFWTPVELLRVVQILDDSPRALSCYKMLLRRSRPVPYAHRCTVSSYSSIGRGSSCKQCVWIPTQARRRQSSRKRLRGFRFFKVFAPVRQAPYIADNFGNIASCPDGGQLPARYRVIKLRASCYLRPLAGPVVGLFFFGGIFPLWGGVCGFCGWLGLVAGDLCQFSYTFFCFELPLLVQTLKVAAKAVPSLPNGQLFLFDWRYSSIQQFPQ